MQGEPTRDQFEVTGKFADGKLVPTTKYGTRRPHEGSDVVLHLASGKTSSPQSIRINRILNNLARLRATVTAESAMSY
jgi:hypothetical protein